MSNQSYCAIENVLNDVRQRIDLIHDGEKDECNEYEIAAAKQLIKFECFEELNELLTDRIINQTDE